MISDPYHVALKQLLQKDFCEKSGVPCVTPEDGKCPMCRRNIYRYITAREAASRCITQCPACHTSFTRGKKYLIGEKGENTEDD